MDQSLQFLYAVFFVSIIMHIITGILTLFLVVPLQIREALIRDDILRLRKELLIRGAVGLVVVVASILALTLRFIIKDQEYLRYIITTMIFIHALGLLIKAVIDYDIYRHVYPRHGSSVLTDQEK